MNPKKPHLLPPNLALKLFDEAKARGLDVHNLTPEQYRELALSIRTTRQKIVDGMTAIESRLATNSVIGWRQVPQTVYDERKSICESNRCGLFGQLAGALPVCHACQCADKFLEAKWKDPRQKCPKNLWDRYRES